MSQQSVMLRHGQHPGARVAFEFLDGSGKFTVKFDAFLATVTEIKKIAAIKQDDRFGVTIFEVPKSKEKAAVEQTKQDKTFQAVKDSIARAQSARTLKGIETKVLKGVKVSKAQVAELKTLLAERAKDFAEASAEAPEKP